MPSARRLRALLLLALAVVITILFFTSQWQQTSERDTRTIQDFYHKTINAMDGRRGSGGSQVVMNGKGRISTEAKDKDGDGTVDEDDQQLAVEMSDRLRAAEQQAKDLANAKAPLKPDSPGKVVGVGSSAGGQGKKDEAAEEGETDEDHEVEVTLTEILKRSPSKFPPPLATSLSVHMLTEMPQQSSSPSRIVRSPKRPKSCFSRSTRSTHPLLSSNSMSIP